MCCKILSNFTIKRFAVRVSFTTIVTRYGRWSTSSVRLMILESRLWRVRDGICGTGVLLATTISQLFN